MWTSRDHSSSRAFFRVPLDEKSGYIHYNLANTQLRDERSLVRTQMNNPPQTNNPLQLRTILVILWQKSLNFQLYFSLYNNNCSKTYTKSQIQGPPSLWKAALQSSYPIYCAFPSENTSNASVLKKVTTLKYDAHQPSSPLWTQSPHHVNDTFSPLCLNSDFQVECQLHRLASS